ncbi:MAG TPA: winged helix-turn-helix domain-containing protein [Pyrinomonadaceae bacterium]|jgi:pentatricopeptide repeat protein
MTSRGIYAYEFGPFHLNVAERLLLRNNQLVSLPPKTLSILLLLVRKKGHLVEKDELMGEVWPDSIVEDNNLTVSMSVLRKALGESQGRHEYIETIPRRGYRFVASVKEIQDEDAAPPRVMHATTHAAEGKRQRIEEREKSIAVLPFRIIGARAEEEYLGVGLADALITKLSNLRQLAVRPTSAVSKYTGGIQDPVSVGRELQVDSVIEGTIQKIGKRLRVTVQLVSIPEGLSLWAEKFDERFTDIFILEDSISEQIMSTLLLKLTHQEKLHLARQHTKNPEAYKQYLKGRFFWNKSRFFRNKRAAQELKKSIEHFEQAITIDRNYGLAYAGLSDSYIVLSATHLLPPNDCLLLAKKAALQALKIDETIAEAHCSLATVRTLYDWDWSGAEPEYKRAIQLNPNYITAHHWYAKYLAKMECYPEAISEIERALELDPLSLVIFTERGRLLYFARQYDRAIEQCLEALQMDPNLNSAHAILGLAYAEKGMYKEAIKHSIKLLNALGDDIEPVAFVAYVYGKAGRIDKAREVFEEWQSLDSSRLISPFYMAVIYTGMGEQAQALAWLERAYAEHTYLLTYINIPIFDSLRSDQKYIDLLERLSLLS